MTHTDRNNIERRTRLTTFVWRLRAGLAALIRCPAKAAGMVAYLLAAILIYIYRVQVFNLDRNEVLLAMIT
ncbi:MAG: hypothetical protein LJU34_03465, partial [Oscillospiraceae bacterium]|nr:hypothetical protein [Oscillospiraceae bacterium]